MSKSRISSINKEVEDASECGERVCVYSFSPPLQALCICKEDSNTTRHCPHLSRKRSPFKERGTHVPSDGVCRPLFPPSVAPMTNLPFPGIVSLKVFIECVFALGSPPPVCTFLRVFRFAVQGKSSKSWTQSCHPIF